ncbi:MAG: hypothetical protein KDB71_01990 [Mycobacterium sp.]|nr:hypothetical protein [Mycobacterium sp.]
MEFTTSLRTRAFARILGPFLTVVPLTAAVRVSEMQTLMSQMQPLLSEFEAEPVWSWLVGALVLLLGLTVVGLHTSWANPAAAIISFVGWAMVLRGVLLMAFPAAFMSTANAVLGAAPLWQIGCIGMALVGMYLAVVGWWPRELPAP